MITDDDLIALVRAYNPATDEALIRDAYAYGAQMHEGQKRRSGEPYFTHPIEVACILAAQHLDDATIVTALLHDTIEDTQSTHNEISARFGPDVALLVDGVTKLTNMQLSDAQTKQAENFRKLFMAMSRDLRVILVKLADRLHNMRTITHMRPEKQRQKARETMEVYAPLAGRMGMQWMREELEDLSFRVLNPDARSSMMRRFLTLEKEAGDVIRIITEDMRGVLHDAGIEARVEGRAKKPYSIWRKMERKDMLFSRLSDIYGFRVLTETENDCYRALGAIHQRWRAVPGRFKDYISQPKMNGYRSLHTTVSGRDGKRVEVQIRTFEMHEVAETGVAAHWSYKDGVRAENRFAVDPSRWIATVAEQLEQEDDHNEFFEAVKMEMLTDQVFCFTPKGDVIQLPGGATPLDFAFAIHTRIGSACVGAKVDGKRVPMWSKLRNGNSVEIITAQGQTPQASWLENAKTGKARAAIRRALRAEDRNRSIKLGREMARAAFEHVGRKASNKALERAALTLRLSGEEELLARLGSAQLSSTEVVQAVYPDLRSEKPPNIDKARAVVGLAEGQQFDRATCCQPLPGERIVGITRPGHGVVVHKIDCDSLADEMEFEDRWIDLHWASGSHAAMPVTLEVTIHNDAGVLGRICTLIGEQKANISDLEFSHRMPDFYRLSVDVEVQDAEQIHRVMSVLEADSDVAMLARRRKKRQAGKSAAAE